MQALKRLLADRRRVKNVAVLAFVVVLVNLPLALSTWTNSRVESAGTDVTATVTAARNLGTEDEPRWWVSYRFPEDVDPEQGTWAAEVDRGSVDGRRAERVDHGPRPRGRAVPAHRVGRGAELGRPVDDPRRRRGAAPLCCSSGAPRRRSPQHEVVEALTDVSPAPPGEAWEELGDGTATIAGVVAAPSRLVVLELGHRVVRVILDGRPTRSRRGARLGPGPAARGVTRAPARAHPSVPDTEGRA